MIRISEMVLPGHPDKFCDQVADAAIAACVEGDADAYGQVEVAVWSDQVWLSGGICTRRPLAKSMRDIVVETWHALGYAPNRPEPLDVCYDMTGGGKREAAAFFHHGVLAERYDPRAITRALTQGGHFFDANAPWNRQAGSLL